MATPQVYRQLRAGAIGILEVGELMSLLAAEPS